MMIKVLPSPCPPTLSVSLCTNLSFQNGLIFMLGLTMYAFDVFFQVKLVQLKIE